jgi:hypothetical protein
MAQGVDSTKIPGRPSHEAVEETGEESEASKLDKMAMESAKRAQNRIHSDETQIPGSSEFTH